MCVAADRKTERRPPAATEGCFPRLPTDTKEQINLLAYLGSHIIDARRRCQRARRTRRVSLPAGVGWSPTPDRREGPAGLTPEERTLVVTPTRPCHWQVNWDEFFEASFKTA